MTRFRDAEGLLGDRRRLDPQFRNGRAFPKLGLAQGTDDEQVVRLAAILADRVAGDGGLEAQAQFVRRELAIDQ